MKNIFINKIKSKLKQLQTEEECLIVLKGIPLSLVLENGSYDVNLEKAVKNKLKYVFTEIDNRRCITYEEFLLLYSILVTQYENIYVLNNNIYMEQYPIDMYYSDEVRNGLLNHFNEDGDENKDDEVILGKIGEYVAIYDGIKQYNGFYLGAYCDEQIYNELKVTIVNIFDQPTYKLENKLGDDDDKFLISEESDYLDLVRSINTEPDEIIVDINSYIGDRNKLIEHIRILAENFKDVTDIYIAKVPEVEKPVNRNPEFSNILKKYWGYDEFRTLKVYDINKLPEKEIIEVSQEKIITDLTEQAENAFSKKQYRDIFVTAPTGSGKSVMFQIPAIYIAEKYEFLTIVISPLIGLMNDQVVNLSDLNYTHVQTINSDMSNIVKEDIKQKIANKEIHILYISPETLLSRSDISELIGNRKIGMVVIDEAHIVTTWGKQFRPDYWYLGDRIRKIRKEENSKFVIATFTATAIYHGFEDMYTETINSLHMINPITYLGYVKRKDITIDIDRTKPAQGQRSEYEFDKFEEIYAIVLESLLTCQKVLIYFPTVALINRCYEYLRAKDRVAFRTVAMYHGSLDKDEKQESYERFRKHFNKENPEDEENKGIKLVMLATKAFGMGVDINDIEKVVHFAPTGNVCDYVQEIGRAARRADLQGIAHYHYNSLDFKHINRLHGLSAIQKYQLVEVVRKIDELYTNMQRKNRGRMTRKRNAMLLDAENFAYIFNRNDNDDGGDINKVKTSLLMIQKDFENRKGFSPITVRPIPLFANGYFSIPLSDQKRMLKMYPDCIKQDEKYHEICLVNLKQIWSKSYQDLSFPKFKYLLYTKNTDLKLCGLYDMTAALRVSIDYENDYRSKFRNLWDTLKFLIGEKVIDGGYSSVEEIGDAIARSCNISKFKAETICQVVIASMNSYRQKFAKVPSRISMERTTKDGKTTYCFYTAVNQYFEWVEKGYADIEQETVNGELYLVDTQKLRTAEISVILGILEAMDILAFNMLGGANSQLYIYVNQIQNLKNIIMNPHRYQNGLLDTVNERHLLSVKMLTYIYENEFNSNEIWDMLENYFLGMIPQTVKQNCLNVKDRLVCPGTAQLNCPAVAH